MGAARGRGGRGQKKSQASPPAPRYYGGRKGKVKIEETDGIMKNT
jgi:hypothetical protein